MNWDWIIPPHCWIPAEKEPASDGKRLLDVLVLTDAGKWVRVGETNDSDDEIQEILCVWQRAREAGRPYLLNSQISSIDIGQFLGLKFEERQ